MGKIQDLQKIQIERLKSINNRDYIDEKELILVQNNIQNLSNQIDYGENVIRFINNIAHHGRFKQSPIHTVAKLFRGSMHMFENKSSGHSNQHDHPAITLDVFRNTNYKQSKCW